MELLGDVMPRADLCQGAGAEMDEMSQAASAGSSTSIDQRSSLRERFLPG